MVWHRPGMWLGNSGMPNCGTPGQPVGLSSSGLNLCFLESLQVPCAQPACSTPTSPPTWQPPAREPSGPPFNSPANSCHTGFCLSLGWRVFISHSIICQSLSGQMSVEGQELFWVVAIPRGVGWSSCSQADCPILMGRGGLGQV